MVMCNIHITMYQQKYCNSIFFFFTLNVNKTKCIN